MVKVEKELNPDFVCNSCLDRESGAYCVNIGDLVVKLCYNCLDNLANSTQKVLNEEDE